MSGFTYSFIGNTMRKNNFPVSIINPKNIFNKNMNYYICSFGGCGSTILFNYLSNFGNVYHIHDRYPPAKLTYVGNENTTEEVYREWFNNVKISENKLNNYKIIFIYRNPLQVIHSRFSQKYGSNINQFRPNINHLKNIKCDENGNINILDVLKSGKDLYKIEEFFDNYVSNKERNYDIYCVKYELFWDNISIFNKALDIPDIKEFYPERKERKKTMYFQQQLNAIYMPLMMKMNKMRFIEIIPKKKDDEMNDQNKINELPSGSSGFSDFSGFSYFS